MKKYTCILALAGMMTLALAASLASAQTVSTREPLAGSPEARPSTGGRKMPPRTSPCGEVGHGIVRYVGSPLDFYGEEMHCWQFLRDDGAEFEIRTSQKLFDGVPATLFGNALGDRRTCYAGTPLEACAVVYDDMRESVGRIALEESCWTFTAGDRKFAVLNPADLADIEGLAERLGTTPARAQIKYIETHGAPTKEVCYLAPIYVVGGRAF